MISNSNGLVSWFSSINLLSSIYIPIPTPTNPAYSTPALEILQNIQPGLSTLSTILGSTIQTQFVSTIGGLAQSGFVNTSALDERTTILSQVYHYISATTLYDIIANLGNLRWITDNAGPLRLIQDELGNFPSFSGGYISTLSNVPNVSSLAGLFSSIGIGMKPSYPLDVKGTIRAEGGVLSNAIFLTSDSNVKENIQPADLGLCYSNVRALPLRRFTYISSVSDAKLDKTQIGFIAQEAAQAFPKSVLKGYEESFGSTIMHLNYDQIFMSHYGATQLLMSTVDAQTARISTLEGSMAGLMSSMESLLGVAR